LLFAVTDFKVGVFDIDLGLGFGMTSGNGILESMGNVIPRLRFSPNWQ
jgi:hypothetical protein